MYSEMVEWLDKKISTYNALWSGATSRDDNILAAYYLAKVEAYSETKARLEASITQRKADV